MSQTDRRPSGRVPEKLQAPHEQPVWRIMRQIWDRMNTKNEHFVAPVVGREGIGKSQTCIKIGTMLDPEFSAENIFFRAEEFLKVLRDDRYSQGDVFILDEAGVSFGNRTWQDRSQVKANQAFQLIRDHNIGVLFSLPRLSELDSQTQGRAHAFFEITHKKDGEHVKGKWKWIDPDRTGTTGKIYKKYPRTRGGRRIKEIGFAPPDQEIVKAYEERKEQFQTEVYEEAIGKLEDDEADEGDDGQTPEDIADIIVEGHGVRRYLKQINNGAQTVLDKEKIMTEYDIGRHRAKQVKSAVMEQIDIDVM